MKPIRILAAALIASGGLTVSTAALAVPKSDPPGTAAGNLILVGQWSRGGDTEDWRNRDGRADRRGDRDGDHRADRRGDDSHDGDHKRHRRTERRDDRHNDWNGRDDRGHHYGWDRGRHYGWGDGGHPRYKARHWRTDHHPRHRYWVGRRLPRVQYVVIEHYDDYYLPPPRRGHYYVRSGNDVYLIAEATHRIIDAFVLLDAVGR